MKTILVNASGAKLGGARTIVESYIKWIEKNDFLNQYVFIVGCDISTTAKNIHIVYLKTDGVGSVFFATLGILYYCIIFRTNIVFSFMNLNIVFPFFKKITYFHQAKFFSEKSLRFLIYKFFLFFQSKSVFICQNSKIKEQLKVFYKNNIKTKVVNLWPGVLIPNEVIKPNWFNDFSNKSGGKIALCPYADIRMKHKAFDLIYDSYDFLKKNNIKVIVTSDNFTYQNNDVFYFVGVCSYSELHFLYKNVDVVLFPSLFETVGLPIFEAQYYGLPVVLSRVDYVENLSNKFKYLNFVYLDPNTFNFDINLLEKKYIPLDHVCFSGNWDQIQQFF